MIRLNALKVFENSEFGALEILLIDGEEYFPATQCAKILGYKNTRDAILHHCKRVVKHDGVSYSTNQYGTTTSQKTSTNYIPEGDLYRLIIRSKLPAAEKFERWVFDEVLPSLRKNGSYGNIHLEEVISKAVTVAVSETIRSAMPLLKPERSLIKEDTKLRYRERSKIASLPTEIRNMVDDMFLSRKYTYSEIRSFLFANGISVSIAAIGKYKNTLYME